MRKINCAITRRSKILNTRSLFACSNSTRLRFPMWRDIAWTNKRPQEQIELKAGLPWKGTMIQLPRFPFRNSRSFRAARTPHLGLSVWPLPNPSCTLFELLFRRPRSANVPATTKNLRKHVSHTVNDADKLAWLRSRDHSPSRMERLYVASSCVWASYCLIHGSCLSCWVVENEDNVWCRGNCVLNIVYVRWWVFRIIRVRCKRANSVVCSFHASVGNALACTKELYEKVLFYLLKLLKVYYIVWYKISDV